MKTIVMIITVLSVLPGSLQAARRDHMHFSPAFNANRYFRVVTPADYDSSGTTRYPVIYYCNGCGGSYTGDSYTSYSIGGYVHPYCDAGLCAGTGSWMSRPFNADFQMCADSLKILVVAVDGNIPTGDGCHAYYPFGNYDNQVSWSGNAYNYSRYIRDLVRTVDSLYPTNPSPDKRALSGLSMGGHSALWIGSANPHLFRSVSHFCHSPTHWSVGAPPNTTPVDVTQLWRNYRGVTTRSSANNQDYLYRYTQQMGVILEGGGDNRYHEAVFYRHWAADMDSQFMFHAATFKTPKDTPGTFSIINPYPSFDAWGYSVSSPKAEKGWIYLKDANRSGMAILTRFRLPYGKPLSNFAVTVTTPSIYTPFGSYRIIRYNYRTDGFSVSGTTADSAGALTLTGVGGMGEEFGIAGNGLKPQAALLTDTLIETVSIPENTNAVLSFDLVNLSESPLTGVTVSCTTSSGALRLIRRTAAVASVPAMGRVRIDSAVILNGTYREFANIGYLRFRLSAGGQILDREQIFQVQVMGGLTLLDSADVEIFDGNTKTLSMLKDATKGGGGAANVVVTEGTGNRNQRADSGEVVSFWFRADRGLDTIADVNLWHPSLPLNGADNPDVSFVGNSFYEVNSGRKIWSAQVRINRTPTAARPIRIPIVSEVVYGDPSPGSARGIDDYSYRYRILSLPLIPISAEQTPAVTRPAFLNAVPNPFKPSLRIHFSAPAVSRPRLDIFAPSGRLVYTARLEGIGSQGFVDWQGRDGSGRALTAGFYVVRLVAGDLVLARKIAYLP